MSVLFRALGFVILTLAFAWLARRVLGANRVSWVRSIAAGIVGVVVGTAAGAALVQVDVNDESSAAGIGVGALLVGPSFLNAIHDDLTACRDEGSPFWRPIVDGGTSVRMDRGDTLALRELIDVRAEERDA